MAIALSICLLSSCHTTKVTKATAVADSIANARKIKHLIDSVRREKIIAEGRAKWAQERAKAMKKNPKNLIDSIKYGINTERVFSRNTNDTIWVSYQIIDQLPEVVKTIFPNVVFIKRCEQNCIPSYCWINAYYNNKVYRFQDINNLLEAIGTKDLDSNTLFLAFINWWEGFSTPCLNIEKVTTVNMQNGNYNYQVEVNDGPYRYYYFQLKEGKFLDWKK